jgi:hypothetical protein
MSKSWLVFVVTAVFTTGAGFRDSPLSCQALDIVRQGKPVATVVVHPAAVDREGRGRSEEPTDEYAAGVLVEWVQKMTGAELPIGPRPPEDKAAVYVGRAAVEAGLRLDGVHSPSHEGLRITSDGGKVLLAGQSGTATVKAVCRLLEQWGCRYLLDHPLGEVYPTKESLTVEKLDVTEKPGFLYRSIWGSRWGGRSLWKIWNGAGGVRLATGHAWGRYVSKDLFTEHPDYFRLRNGQREPSDWYCTSNRQLRAVFAEGVIRQIESGTPHPSLSPPDGRSYCECQECSRQDDPDAVEPSSGYVSVTNRYVDFYQDVARRVAKTSPESILNFYCYADYTQAPTSGIKLEPNLCAWIAPIRYCRYHRIGQPDCPSRRQLSELIDGWGAAAGKIAYRTYNYNLAECTVPFSLISVWKHDIPYLKKKGCIGINLETLANWQIYGPHIYLSIRLAYDPEANADGLLEDYFLKLYGPAAGPILKEYWAAIDQRFVDLKCHTGSFYPLHLVYTPDFLDQCRQRVNRAIRVTEADKTYGDRVRMAGEGLRNAEQYVALRSAMNRGDFAAAKQVYQQLLARSEEHAATGLGNHYTVNYLKRFVGRHVAAGAEAVAPPRKLIMVLPDRWRMAYDEAASGLEQGYHQPDCDDQAWQDVATYSNPLDAQDLPDRQTVLWYRTKIQIPDRHGALALFFTEVDGDATVFCNGKRLGESEKPRVPFEVDATDAAVPGENLISVRVDHSKITELFLGGIIRPVLLIDAGP